MMQPSAFALAVGVLGATQLTHAGELVEEHLGLAHTSGLVDASASLTNTNGLVEGPANPDVSAIALSKWPPPVKVIQSTKVITLDSAGETALTSMTFLKTRTKRPKVTTTTTTTTKPWDVQRRQLTSSTTLPISTPKKVVTVSSTSTVISATAIAPSLTSIVFPPGLATISITSVPVMGTGTTTNLTTTTTTGIPSIGVIVHVTAATTTTMPASSTKVVTKTVRPPFPTDVDGKITVGGFPECKGDDDDLLECYKRHAKHLLPSKKWLWLLTIPVVLFLAIVPCCLYVARSIARRNNGVLQNNNEKPIAPAGPQVTQVATDGRGTVGRQAEEGRGRVAMPADTVSSAPATAGSEKVAAVPSSTVQHVESVPQHDGTADSHSNTSGSLRGRKPAPRVPLLMRWPEEA